MTLIAEEREFYQLASQYESITRQMLQISANNSDMICVSAINSVATYFLPKVYHIYLQAFSHYHLEIQDMELDTAEKCLLDGITDLAFTSGRTSDERLIQTPIYVGVWRISGALDFMRKRTVL